MNTLKSFQNKIILLIAASLITAAALITAIGLRNTSNIRKDDARQIMSLLCTENANKLNGHFRNTEQTVHILYDYTMNKLEKTDSIYNPSQADSVLKDVRIMSFGAASNLEASAAVYLRLNPDIFSPTTGFFLTPDTKGFFRDTKLTDLNAYDPTDISHVGWYYLPKASRKPMWMMPYYNKNIGVSMISYVIPIYHDDTFMGIIGMDLDLDQLEAMINDSNLPANGYAYLSDQDGNMIYDTIDQSQDSDWMTYSQALTNGMTLSVTSPVDEINPSSPELFRDIILAVLAVMIDTVSLAALLAVRLNNTLSATLSESQQSQQLAYEAANKANSAKSEFLSRMSHDIRTPLNGIKGMIEILRKNRQNPEKVDDCIDKIDISASHLLSLLNDILDLQKLESGKMVFSKEPFDLNQLLDSCIVITQTLAVEQNLSICFEKTGIIHPSLYGSPSHLRQIFLNVLSNAVKYNKPYGCITIRAGELPCEDNTAHFCFEFEDTGIGMNKEYLEHIFDPFSQENPGFRTTYTGSGLGMPIIKNIVDRMGGTVTVTSEEGTGTSVRIELAFEICEDTYSKLETVSSPAEYSGLKALVAEDNSINMEITKYLLEDVGITVTPAGNGREALDFFASSAPGTYSLIFMDIMMPVMDGLTAAKEIRSLSRPDAASVPIIALTANAFTENIKKCREAGMNDHIAKPLDINRIYRILAQYITQPEEDSHDES